MKLSEFFEKAGTRNIVINADLDGFLSGMILQRYYYCRVVGFSSNSIIWLKPEIESLRDPIYIDIFINDPRVYCIDQHIVAADNTDIERIISYGTKLNPNLDLCRRTFIGDLGKNAGYLNKYPFGTVHYLIALMKQDGIDVETNPLDQIYSVTDSDNNTYNITPGQLILRADSAMHNSLNSKYEVNAKNWWKILKQFGSETIEDLSNYIYNYKNEWQRQGNSDDEKKRIIRTNNDSLKRNSDKFLQNGLKTDGGDGRFNEVESEDGILKPEIISFSKELTRITGTIIDLPKSIVRYSGREVKEPYKYNETDLSQSFTYAFVNSTTVRYTAYSGLLDEE